MNSSIPPNGYPPYGYSPYGYPPYRHTIPKTSFFTSVFYGLIFGVLIAGLIFGYWWYWAVNTYKWSAMNISNHILSKYSQENKDKLKASGKLVDNKTYLKATGALVANDKSYATCNIEIRDAVSQAIKESTPVKYMVDNDCSPVDTTCIQL
jgi:hypothetical protein